MKTVENALYEFEGQLSYQDILHMTNKELEILRRLRRERKMAEQKRQPVFDPSKIK